LWPQKHKNCEPPLMMSSFSTLHVQSGKFLIVSFEPVRWRIFKYPVANQHFYEPTSRSVQLDGIDVHELSSSWLSKNVAVVFNRNNP
jgi:hypothetical protein